MSPGTSETLPATEATGPTDGDPTAYPSTERTRQIWRHPAVLFGVLGAALVVVSVLAAGVGQLSVPPGEVVGSVLRRVGLELGTTPAHPNGEAALWTIRFPRVVMAMLVGAALAVAGALMQGCSATRSPSPGSPACRRVPP